MVQRPDGRGIRHIRSTTMRHFRHHADGFPQRGMRVNHLADVHRISVHLNRQGNLTNHVARMRADHGMAGVTEKLGFAVKSQASMV